MPWVFSPLTFLALVSESHYWVYAVYAVFVFPEYAVWCPVAWPVRSRVVLAIEVRVEQWCHSMWTGAHLPYAYMPNHDRPFGSNNKKVGKLAKLFGFRGRIV